MTFLWQRLDYFDNPLINTKDFPVPEAFAEDRRRYNPFRLTEDLSVFITSYLLRTSYTEVESHKIVVIDLLEEKGIGQSRTEPITELIF